MHLRLTTPVVSEDTLHESVAKALDLLLAPPAQWTTFPAGHTALPPQSAAKLARLGLKRGWPDIQVVYHGIYGIELKVPGGVLSKTRVERTPRGRLRILDGQVEVFARLRRAGMAIAICRSVDDVLSALAGWGVPLRCRA